MVVSLAFWSFLIGCLVLGWQAGDRADRKIILCVFAAAGSTHLSDLLFETHAHRYIVRVIDFALLMLVIRYALLTKRYWPVWFAGILACANVLGLSALFLPPREAAVLFVASSAWAVPSLIVLTAGLLLDQGKGIRTR